MPIIGPPEGLHDRCFGMMTRTKMLCARAGASAIAAALALSPTHAAAPKPIVDLSKSAALSGKAEAAPPKQAATNSKPMIGPFDQQQALELGGGAIALLLVGAGGVAVARSRRKKRETAEWGEDSTVTEHDPLFDEPMFKHEPAAMEEKPAVTEASAFAWGNGPRSNQQRTAGRRGESWVERAYRGPTPDNPSLSLRTRLKRAAFFDKREREVAAGKAAPVDADAGLPEAVADEREREAA